MYQICVFNRGAVIYPLEARRTSRYGETAAMSCAIFWGREEKKELNTDKTKEKKRKILSVYVRWMYDNNKVNNASNPTINKVYLPSWWVTKNPQENGGLFRRLWNCLLYAHTHSSYFFFPPPPEVFVFCFFWLWSKILGNRLCVCLDVLVLSAENSVSCQNSSAGKAHPETESKDSVTSPTETVLLFYEPTSFKHVWCFCYVFRQSLGEPKQF